MGNKLNDLITMGSANIISTAIYSVFWIYLASLLGSEHYGEINYFISISGIAVVLALLGAENSVIVYATKKPDILPPMFFITIVSGIVASVILFLVFVNLGVSLYVISNVAYGLATYVMLGRKMYKGYSKYVIGQRIMLVIFSVSLYYVMGPSGVLLGFALASFPFSLKVYQELRGFKMEFATIKSHSGFVMTSYLLSITRTFSNYVDKIFVYPLFGAALLGNYALGTQVLSALGLLPLIVYQYTLPHDASRIQNRRLKIFTVLVSILLAFLSFLLTPMILPVFFPKYVPAIQIIQIIGFGSIPLTVNLMFISNLLGNEKIKTVITGAMIYLSLQVSLIFFLGKIWGINGVALSLVLAASAESLYLIIINRFIIREKSTK